jgi:hypothetical protein
MNRYRNLTREELEAVEPDVVQFLSESGVTAADWEAWKSANDPRVEELITEFSIGFWDRATDQIQCLERRTGDEVWVFRFEEESASLIRCVMDEGNAQWFRGEKEFPKEARGREIFLLLEQGAHPVDSSRWEAVQQALKGASVN